MSEYLKRLREAAMRTGSDHLWTAIKNYKKTPIVPREMTIKKDIDAGIRKKKRLKF